MVNSKLSQKRISQSYEDVLTNIQMTTGNRYGFQILHRILIQSKGLLILMGVKDMFQGGIWLSSQIGELWFYQINVSSNCISNHSICLDKQYWRDIDKKNGCKLIRRCFFSKAFLGNKTPWHCLLPPECYAHQNNCQPSLHRCKLPKTLCKARPKPNLSLHFFFVFD